jgi:hypothetical protein
MRALIGKFLINIGEKLLGQNREDVDLEGMGKILLPERYQKYFITEELQEKRNEWLLILREKREEIPTELIGKDAVLNGYKDPVEILHFPLGGKNLYLKLYRRKWKERGKSKSYSNQYRIHRQGMKTTDEFGDFLKELTRQERSEYFRTFKNIRHIIQEDF